MTKTTIIGLVLCWILQAIVLVVLGFILGARSVSREHSQSHVTASKHEQHIPKPQPPEKPSDSPSNLDQLEVVFSS